MTARDAAAAAAWTDREASSSARQPSVDARGEAESVRSQSRSETTSIICRTGEHGLPGVSGESAISLITPAGPIHTVNWTEPSGGEVSHNPKEVGMGQQVIGEKASGVKSFDDAIEAYRRALEPFVTGDPDPGGHVAVLAGIEIHI